MTGKTTVAIAAIFAALTVSVGCGGNTVTTRPVAEDSQQPWQFPLPEDGLLIDSTQVMATAGWFPDGTMKVRVTIHNLGRDSVIYDAREFSVTGANGVEIPLMPANTGAVRAVYRPMVSLPSGYSGDIVEREEVTEFIWDGVAPDAMLTSPDSIIVSDIWPLRLQPGTVVSFPGGSVQNLGVVSLGEPAKDKWD